MNASNANGVVCAAALWVMLAGGCAGSGRLYPPGSQEPTRTIYVVSHGWHAGLFVRADEAVGQLPPLGPSLAGATYLEIGWGDAGFYQAERINSGLTLAALLLPTPSVMHVVAVRQEPAEAFPDSEIITLTVSKRGFDRMLQFVRKSFEMNADGEPVDLGRGLYGQSRFFKGRGFYHGLHTCNVWTGRAVYATGVPVLPQISIRTEVLFAQLRAGLKK
jgi:uncharacterized protein (TIGR02117 family)